MGNGKQAYTMRKVALNLNGISIAYVLGLVNAVMAVVNAFGLNLTDTQRVAIVGLVNAALVLAIHLAHRIGEAAASGQAHEVAKSKMDSATETSMGG